MRWRGSIATLVLAGLAGCASCDQVPAGAVTDCNAQIVPGGAATDLLLVIDDSGSMTPKQVKLADQLGTFIDQLLSSAIALDLHVAVTNTSIDEYGTSTTSPGRASYLSGAFPGPPGTPFPAGTAVAIEQDPSGVGSAAHFMWGTSYDDPDHLVSTWGGPRLLSSSALSRAELARDFKANVLQGNFGSGKEQPLRAMALALAKAGAGRPNFPFQRDGARLAVVILTDEDDCSDSAAPYVTSDASCHNQANWGQLDPLPAYVSTLTAVDAEPVVAVIGEYVGTTAKVCEAGPFPSGQPVPPARLDQFLTLLDPAGTHTLRASLCDDFGTTLLSVARMIVPQTMPLQQSPQDYRLMVVSVLKSSGVTQPCEIQPAGSSGAAGAGVVYTPAPAGGLPSLTFQGVCRLGIGDRVDLRIVCAR
jgi:hypothetical protein